MRSRHWRPIRAVDEELCKGSHNRSRMTLSGCSASAATPGSNAASRPPWKITRSAASADFAGRQESLVREMWYDPPFLDSAKEREVVREKVDCVARGGDQRRWPP